MRGKKIEFVRPTQTSLGSLSLLSCQIIFWPAHYSFFCSIPPKIDRTSHNEGGQKRICQGNTDKFVQPVSVGRPHYSLFCSIPPKLDRTSHNEGGQNRICQGTTDKFRAPQTCLCCPAKLYFGLPIIAC